jgi:SRSO17 transposase
LRERQLQYAVQVEPTTVVWTTDPNLPLPAPTKKKLGRSRRYPPPAALARPQSLEEVARQLPALAWRRVTWRQGSRDAQRSRFALLKVWTAHGWQQQLHPLRVMEWRLVEWPQDETEPTKYWLAQLGTQALGLRRCVRIAKARWRIEQDYRELKEELGLDHYEGRQWLVGIITSASSPSPMPSSVPSRRALKKTAGASWSLPQVRRQLLALLIRLSGRCAWCLTEFIDSS